MTPLYNNLTEAALLAAALVFIAAMLFARIIWWCWRRAARAGRSLLDRLKSR